MPVGFKTFEDIIRFAIRREETAYRLYKGAAAKATNAAARKMFEEMAADEEAHYDNFDKQEQHLEKFGEQFLAL